MATRTTSHSYPLVGGKASVRSRMQQIRGTFRGASLFGPRYLTLLRAARAGNRQRMHEAERTWAKHAARAADLTIETHGMHRVDTTAQYVVAPLHEGFADVIALSSLPLDLAYSAAEELFDWRLLGRYLNASKQSPVSLHNRTAAYRSIVRAAEKSFCRNESYVLFPQGSILGIETAFHQGAFQLSARSGKALLPVVLTGGSSVWEYPYTTSLNFGQTIRLEVLEPVDAGEVLRRAPGIESEMKERALAAIPGPRRFDPDRDGWWDGYPYEIDPAFPELARQVADHRATNPTVASLPNR